MNDKHSALNLVKELDYFSDVYAALRDPDDVRWNKDEKSALAQLIMFNVRQPLSMLIASYNIFFEEQRASFTKVLLSIAMLSFRYNIICNLKTYEQENYIVIYQSAYFKIA
uniref:Uncharacterized protein n=1 Tax=Arsenophonus endosymbiont of Trialeurodes vaporariorum TaxID=235567 RepID=A0A3B0M1Q5_9GAMM